MSGKKDFDEQQAQPEFVTAGDTNQDTSVFQSMTPGPNNFPSESIEPGVLVANKFEIIENLGSGGMGTVYKARDISLGRLVALKLLSRAFVPNEHAWARFHREAKAAGALHHPGLVAIHELSQMDDGTPLIVMDYIEGVALAEHFVSNSLSPQQSLEIINEICGALSFAHEHGVVHRDIKPANIMLTALRETATDSGACSVKLVDFGIAKLEGSEHSVTKTGEVFGSPLYMSPEQCMGAKVDSRSDIYSLGCVLFEMLTGKPPYQSESALAIAVQHIQSEIPDLTESYHGNFKDINKVLKKALAKRPEDRYQSMKDFGADVRRLQNGESISAVEQKLSSAQAANGAASPILADYANPAISMMGSLVLFAVSGHEVHNLPANTFILMLGMALFVFSFWRSPFLFQRWSRFQQSVKDRPVYRLVPTMAILLTVVAALLAVALIQQLEIKNFS